MRKYILLCVLASTGADWKDDPKMVEFYNKLNKNSYGTYTKIQPTSKPASTAQLSSEPEVLSKQVSQPDVTVDVKETLATVKSINSRMILLENNFVAMSHQLTNLDSRLSTLERGSVQPFRAPSRLTDPLAAQVAGRQVGMYDQFGRFIPQQQSAGISSTSTSNVGPPSVSQPSIQPTVMVAAPVHSSIPVQVLQQPMMAVSAFQYSSMSVGGCSGGSCRRPGIISRIFRRR
jgi:hypothetical protein